MCVPLFVIHDCDLSSVKPVSVTIETHVTRLSKWQYRGVVLHITSVSINLPLISRYSAIMDSCHQVNLLNI